jgi:hypothetical protein
LLLLLPQAQLLLLRWRLLLLCVVPLLLLRRRRLPAMARWRWTLTRHPQPWLQLPATFGTFRRSGLG